MTAPPSVTITSGAGRGRKRGRPCATTLAETETAEEASVTLDGTRKQPKLEAGQMTVTNQKSEP